MTTPTEQNILKEKYDKILEETCDKWQKAENRVLELEKSNKDLLNKSQSRKDAFAKGYQLAQKENQEKKTLFSGTIGEAIKQKVISQKEADELLIEHNCEWESGGEMCESCIAEGKIQAQKETAEKVKKLKEAIGILQSNSLVEDDDMGITIDDFEFFKSEVDRIFGDEK